MLRIHADKKHFCQKVLVYCFWETALLNGVDFSGGGLHFGDGFEDHGAACETEAGAVEADCGDEVGVMRPLVALRIGRFK